MAERAPLSILESAMWIRTSLGRSVSGDFSRWWLRPKKKEDDFENRVLAAAGNSFGIGRVPRGL